MGGSSKYKKEVAKKRRQEQKDKKCKNQEQQNQNIKKENIIDQKDISNGCIDKINEPESKSSGSCQAQSSSSLQREEVSNEENSSVISKCISFLKKYLNFDQMKFYGLDSTHSQGKGQIDKSKEDPNTKFENQDEQEIIQEINFINSYTAEEQKTVNEDNYQKQFSNKNQCEVGSFQNLGNTCYINTALQTLRQISLIKPSLFQNSEFGRMLLELFTSKCKNRKRALLQKVFSISQESQRHEIGGGDAFVCFLSLVNNLLKDTKSIECQQDILRNFYHQYKDGLYCAECKWDESTYPPFTDMFIGIQEDAIQKILNPPLSFYEALSLEMSCPKCTKNVLIAKKELVQIPYFLILRIPHTSVSQPQFINKTQSINNFHAGKTKKTKDKKKEKKSQEQPSPQTQDSSVNQRQLNLLSESIELEGNSYQTIGFSNHMHSHYTYVAKRDYHWISYSDYHQSTIKDNEISTSHVNYYLLQQIQALK